MANETAADGGLAVRLARWCARALGVVTAIFLMAMMFVTTIDVAGRYLFGKPLPGAFEITQVLLAATIFAGLPLVTLREEHVTVELLTGRLKGRTAELHKALVSLVGTGVFLVIGWQLSVQAQRLAAYGDTTSLLRIPMAPLAWSLCALSFLSAAILLALTVAHLAGGGRAARLSRAAG